MVSGGPGRTRWIDASHRSLVHLLSSSSRPRSAYSCNMDSPQGLAAVGRDGDSPAQQSTDVHDVPAFDQRDVHPLPAPGRVDLFPTQYPR